MKKLLLAFCVCSSLCTPNAFATVFNVWLCDDCASIPLSIGFDFEFFGTTHSEVVVGSNGFLTFGGSDTSPFESVYRFLNHPMARIGVWDDFNPQTGGTITITQDASSFTALFANIPEFAISGSNQLNTFSISLFSNGAVEIDLISLYSKDSLVGISPGYGAPDPGEIDFSASAGPFNVRQTTYELFTGDFDLNGRTLRFEQMAVPAPASLSLIGLGLLGIFFAQRKSKRR